jgi:hypothetical protein
MLPTVAFVTEKVTSEVDVKLPLLGAAGARAIVICVPTQPADEITKLRVLLFSV